MECGRHDSMHHMYEVRVKHLMHCTLCAVPCALRSKLSLNTSCLPCMAADSAAILGSRFCMTLYIDIIILKYVFYSQLLHNIEYYEIVIRIKVGITIFGNCTE